MWQTVQLAYRGLLMSWKDGVPDPDSRPVRVGNARRIRVAFETEEFDDVARQQFRVGRAVRRMARLAAFGFDRRVLVNERPLFVGVAFDAGRYRR